MSLTLWPCVNFDSRPACEHPAKSATQRSRHFSRPVHRRPCRPQRAKNDDAEDRQLSERLRNAESEAKELRRQLDAARQTAGTATEEPGKQSDAPTQQRRSRIDGADLKREGLFSGRSANWLDESGISSAFRAKGPVEAVATITQDEAAVVKRRLLIGLGLAAGATALALIPTDSLRLSKPSKPLFLYLVPIVRSQELLMDLEDIVGNGRWDELEPAMARIQGSPTNLVQNLRDAAVSLTNGRSKDQAGTVIRQIVDDLDAIDYRQYYSSVKRRGANTGAENQQFADFSVRAVKSVRAHIKEFLALMPASDVSQAREAAQSMQ
ncbi:hypothetical protein WJX73_006489 [Symbiochloris irregularis]|uniref:Uncharacterized protein n=1 Tax=Symbiochloris irregularis TaxID=706552 RepID=A0AAW1PBC6_9CHLO